MSGRFWLPDATGVDPYDALRGERIPEVVRAAPRLRQGAIQLRKRSPVDLSKLLGVRPFVMAKALGCLIWAEARAAAVTGELDRDRIARLSQALAGAGMGRADGEWGYEFDVQTRWAFYAAGSPNLIATAFVGRGLLEAGLVYDSSEAVDGGLSCASFLNRDLLRPLDAGRAPVYHYTRDTKRLIHNANLLGCALSVSATAFSNRPEWVASALAAADVTIDAQRPDGSWPYGDTDSLGWVDSFHTAYNLDGLLQLWLRTGSARIRESLLLGAEYWSSNFFDTTGAPRYYATRARPYDIHSAATAVDVGARLASWGFIDAQLPMRVARWTADNLVDQKTGRTYYQRHRLWTDRRNFVRWGDAHWALARASLLLIETEATDPLETKMKDSRDE